MPPVFIRPLRGPERPLCALTSATVGSIDCVPQGQELFLEAHCRRRRRPPSSRQTASELDQPCGGSWHSVTAAAPEAVASSRQSNWRQPPPQLFCHFAEGTALALLLPDGRAVWEPPVK